MLIRAEVVWFNGPLSRQWQTWIGPFRTPLNVEIFHHRLVRLFLSKTKIRTQIKIFSGYFLLSIRTVGLIEFLEKWIKLLFSNKIQVRVNRLLYAKIGLIRFIPIILQSGLDSNFQLLVSIQIRYFWNIFPFSPFGTFEMLLLAFVNEQKWN